MKICFLLHRRFGYIAHNLAVWLKEKYGLTEFCGYVSQRWVYDFLKAQNEIKYSSLILDEDIHKKYKNEKLDREYLAYLEREFGIPNLWPYIAVDRILMSGQFVREYPYDKSPYTHEEMMRILQVYARDMISFLDKEKPDCLLFSVIGDVGTYLLYKIAEKKGIKTYHVQQASIHDRYLLSENQNFFTSVEEKMKRNEAELSPEAKEQAKKFLEEFRNRPAVYDDPNLEGIQKRMKRTYWLKFLKPLNFLRSLWWYLQVIKYYFTEHMKHHDFTDEMHPWYYLVDRVKRKARVLRGNEDLYDKVDYKEDYAFFPLHMEPEVVLLFFAPFYTNQINLIKQVARSLPVHFKLYVKEHPLMAEYRPRKFYKELKKIPNVRLMDPRTISFDLIRNAKLITTITGNAGWEATLLKKPVVCFGDQFYANLSMIKRSREIERLPYLVKEQLENFQYNEPELLKFIAAVFEESTPVGLIHLWEKETDDKKKKEGLEPLADLFAKKLGLDIRR